VENGGQKHQASFQLCRPILQPHVVAPLNQDVMRSWFAAASIAKAMESAVEAGLHHFATQHIGATNVGLVQHHPTG
jgi:hypothetical protein